MPQWNGLQVSVEAHRIALQIQKVTGLINLPENFNIAPVKSDLRRFYVATGGKRGEGGYEPNAREYRRVYNGAISGAALLKANGGGSGASDDYGVDSDVVVEEAAPEAAVEALKALLGGQKIDPAAVKRIAVDAVNGRVGEVMAGMGAIIAEEVAKAVRTVEVQIANLPKTKIQTAHRAFDRVLRYAANRKSVMLVGPAGSGKTTLAEQIATALGLDFYMSGKCADEVKITGYMDGGGTYRTTAFRKAYEFGGVFLFDEMDGWSPDALIAVNAPLAGQWGDFPDAMVKRHPDFVAIGAANTYGRGADRQYVGREQLDAATLDRFAVIEIDYDEDLEMAISCDRDWTKYVQKVRKAVMTEKVRHVVSPRASIEGGIMLKAGEPRKDVEDAYLWKGLDEPVKNRVLAAVR